MMENRHWMPTDSKWKSGCGPSTTRSGGLRKQGAPRRTEPTAAAGLTATEKLWPDLQQADAWVHQASHLLANTEQYDADTLKPK